MAKGDNSFDLGKARFLAIWILNREIEARVPQLLAKYNVQRFPDRDDMVPMGLKALMEECESEAEYDHACKIAEQCHKREERRDDEALEEAIPDLTRLDRHERCAWSHYQRAVHRFMNIKLILKLEKDHLH